MSTTDRCTLHFDEVFDLRAAQRVEEAMAAVSPGGSVVVDLSRVREVHAVGLGLLARMILRSGEAPRLDVRGLRDQQHRLLRYLGVELATDRPSRGSALH